jgi:uncharacterized protein involved in outer membrane biogenesis
MRWKWVVAIGLLMIVILIATVYVYLNTYDYNKLKPVVARMVEDVTGRKLSLGGELKLEIGFVPTLVVTNIALANVSWGSQPQMIEIERLQAQVRLLPLLFRDVQVNHLSLAGVKVLLETGPSSQNNWAFLAKNGSAASSGAFKPTAIALDQLSIENLHLTFRRYKTDSKTQFTLASLAMTRQGTEDALMLKFRADYNGQPVVLSGKTGRIRELFAHERFPLQLSGKFSNAAVKIDGAIEDVLNLNGIDLRTHASGTNLEDLRLGLGIKLPKTNAFEVTGQLVGSWESLAFKDVSGNLSASGVHMAISGMIGDLMAISGVDLELTASGKDLAEIGPIIGEKLPETDDFKVQGRLTGSAKVLSLSEAKGSARRDGLNLALEGGIKNLLNFNGVDLVAKGSGKDLSKVGAIIGEKLPATDEFAVEGRLTGSAKNLSLKEVQGSAKQGSLSVALSGEVKDLIAFSGLDLQLKGSGKNLAEIGSIVGEKLPATDEFAVEGRLMGSAKNLSLQKAHGQARKGNLNLVVNGQIKNLPAFSGVDLKVKGWGRNLAEFVKIFDTELPATDEFSVQVRLTGSGKTLSLHEAQGRARRGSLNLMVSGRIEDLLTFRGIGCTLKASGKELGEIGPLFGTELPELGPFDVSGNLSGSAKALSLNEFSATVDKSDFKGLAKVEFLKRPKISVRLGSSVIDFTPLVKSLEKDGQKAANKVEQKRPLFSDKPLPLDALKKVDVDILLKARNIRAREAHLEFGQLSLKLEDGEFNIDTLEATYKGAKISGNFQIISSSPSRVATRFLVQSLDLGGLLRETGVNDQVRATVDMAAHLNGRGDSVHSLVAHLDGSIGAVMGEGYLTKYLDLLSMNLTQKVIDFWGRHEKANQIKCAVVQFDIKEGLATSRAFVFNTEIGTLTGEGEINLGTEQINFLLVPKPVYPSLGLSTQLRVEGTITDAKVRPDKLALLKKGARALSSLAIGPLGLLAPFVNLGAHKKHPCEIQSIGQLGLQSPAPK